MGAALFVVLHAFASGGAAVTGVEAISNGVPAFRKPAWKNARQTLVIMGTLLGIMFLGLSVLAAQMHVAPFDEGTPTVISQIGELVYGSGPLGHVLFYSLQAGTMLILVLAANTSFADFPRLASFHAGDNFMPRQLTKRGHRLVFSNGIIFLAGGRDRAAAGHRRQGRPADPALRDRRVHLLHAVAGRHGEAPPHARRSRAGARACSSTAPARSCRSSSTVIIAVTKFTHGAWVIIVLVPVMVVFLLRLNRQYATRGRASSCRRARRRSRRRSCAATSCSCSSTGSTSPARARSSTPAR